MDIGLLVLEHQPQPGKLRPSATPLTAIDRGRFIAAGADPRWARQQRGGLFNVGGYQSIFNTQIGGDHSDRLHIGIRRGR